MWRSGGGAAGEAPSQGVVEVAPGVLRVTMPLPFALDHVHVWLLEDGDGWTLVDTGIRDRASRARWERLESELLGGRPVQRILCTHHHPDHIGLAAWLAGRWGAEIWCSQGEWLVARIATLESPETAAEETAYYLRAGVPPAQVQRLEPQTHSYRQLVAPVPAGHRVIRDGESIAIGGTEWRVVVGRGHTPEHACLIAPERSLFLAGDQVLPQISPNVSVWAFDPEAEPLSEFLETLAALHRLPDDLLVLPSHGPPFRGLHRRLDELVLHHRERLDLALAACAEPRTAWEVMQALFPMKLDPHQTSFALGESLAHLRYLTTRGLLSRDRPAGGSPDRYRRNA
jgi:glyoxylase-like metal-dependent hydrolase (beta-lactamase superfamily II)